MDIPDNVVNPALYRKARKKADETYKKNSAYKSMFIVSEYKRLGGKYRGEKTLKGVKRWNAEKWIQVLPFVESGKRVACGFGDGGKGCRPSKRIDIDTPMTIQEVIKKHGKKKVTELAKKKRNNMSLRIDWKEGKVS